MKATLDMCETHLWLPNSVSAAFWDTDGDPTALCCMPDFTLQADNLSPQTPVYLHSSP